jgi:hypothetical protein
MSGWSRQEAGPQRCLISRSYLDGQKERAVLTQGHKDPRYSLRPLDAIPMSASLIGRLGSSAFRLSTTAVSMSLAGSCLSPDSALGPFHHGIRGQGGTIFWAAFPLRER